MEEYLHHYNAHCQPVKRDGPGAFTGPFAFSAYPDAIDEEDNWEQAQIIARPVMAISEPRQVGLFPVSVGPIHTETTIYESRCEPLGVAPAAIIAPPAPWPVDPPFVPSEEDDDTEQLQTSIIRVLPSAPIVFVQFFDDITDREEIIFWNNDEDWWVIAYPGLVPPVEPRYDVPKLKTGLNPTAPWHWVRDVRGNTYLANGIDRPQVWDGLATATRNWGIDAATTAPTAGVGAAGVLTGTYYYRYSWLNNNTGVWSNPSAVSGSVTLAAQKGAVSGVPSSNSDSQVTHWRLWRNTAGQSTTFYKVADIAIGTTTYTDNIADSTITANTAMTQDHDPPNSWQAYVAFHKGRFHIFGGRIESAGTVSVTNGSAAVVGTGTDFKPSHVGQTFVVPGDVVSYTVSTVTDTTHLTLTATYGGSNNSAASYKLFPGSDRAQWNWSLANEEEYFPAANSAKVFENDDDEPSGLFLVGSQLFAAKRRHIYNLLFEDDPLEGGIYERISYRGLVNQRCVVVVGHEAYLLDEQGVYTFDGNSTVTPIDQAVNRLIQPSTEASADRVNWTYRDKFHAVWDPKKDRVLFFVCLGTDTECKNAFVYERRRQRWTVESYSQAITSSAPMRDSANRVRSWVADENGLVWALGVSSAIDGAPPSANGTVRGTATGATSTTLTDSTASFYTAGDKLIGVPVYIYEGTGSGQTRIVSTNTATVLTVSSAWTTTPDTTSKYRLGMISLQAKTKWFPLEDPGTKSRLNRLRVYFEPQSSDFTVGLKLYFDMSETVFMGWQGMLADNDDGLEIPTTALTDGIVLLHMDQAQGYVEVPLVGLWKNWARIEFVMTDTERKPKIFGWELLSANVPGTGRRGG